MTTELAVTTFGDRGPLIVFLHGLFGQGRNWTSVAKALSGQARILLPDLPDHGRSPWSGAISYPAMAGAVATTIAARWPDEPVALIGHSMGGKVGMMLALQRPDLVDRLGVVDISPVTYPGLRNFGDYVRGMRSLDLTTLSDRSEAEHHLTPYVPDPVIRSFLLQNLRRGADPDRSALNGARWHWQMNLELLARHLPDLGAWPEPAVEPYGKPVLWIAGAQSRYIQPEFGPAMRAHFPRTQLITVKDAGHWVHVDHPDLFLATVRRFVHLD